MVIGLFVLCLNVSYIIRSAIWLPANIEALGFPT